MRLVILESPYAGEVEANVLYARACLKDSLSKGESPIASHLLYTQPGVLDDLVADERALGIAAGLAWRRVAESAVFYVDRGWSRGMVAARETYDAEGKPYEERRLDPATLAALEDDRGRITDGLVDRFASALEAKLRMAEAKYGWRNKWLRADWREECQGKLAHHVGKGDPRDVAAYAAFCWHHGWPTSGDGEAKRD